jgi:Bromodomain
MFWMLPENSFMDMNQPSLQDPPQVDLAPPGANTNGSPSKEVVQDPSEAEPNISQVPVSAPASTNGTVATEKSTALSDPNCETQIDTKDDSNTAKPSIQDGPMKMEVKSNPVIPPKASTGVASDILKKDNEIVNHEVTSRNEGFTTPKDPNQGRLVEQLKVLPSGTTGPLVGEVQGLQEADGRIPTRYSVQWTAAVEETDTQVIQQDDWLTSDLNADVPPTGNLQFVLDRIQDRYQAILEHELDGNPMVSQLLLYAAIEEALQTNLQQAAIQQQEGEAGCLGGTAGATKLGSKSNPHPPLYYTTNPSSYLQAPTATDTRPTSTGNQVVMTPASLGQRVRAGCQWANRYVVSRMPPPSVTVTAPVHQRRSLRQPKPSWTPQAVPMPTPVQTGGRVAMWLIEQLEKETERSQTGKKEDVKETHPSADAPKQSVKSKAAPTQKPSKSSSKKKKKPDAIKVSSSTENALDVIDGLSDDEDESEKPDDDDDYGSNDAMDEAEDDEDLDDVERESNDNLRLSPAPEQANDEEDNDGGSNSEGKVESEEEIQRAVLYENPYLRPNLAALVDHLSRPKALSAEDIQKALMDVVMRIKFNKRSSAVGLDTNSLITVDQVVLDQETPDYPPGKVVLKPTGDETYSELQKLEINSFSRSKFVLDVIASEEAGIQTQRKQELLLQEIEFKQKKAWAKWRHKGIHEGYATWPSWYDAILAWVEQNVAVAPAEPDVAPIIAAPAEDDEALAKSLEEAEDTSGRRRTVRRAAAAASDGVYYGNQSSLTQKQVQDALIRLVKANKFQTLLRLQALVGDDSSDPLKRCRVALGKLVWKRNLMVRKSMDSDLSDAELVNSIRKVPLLSLPSVEEDTDLEISKPPEPDHEMKALIDYIRNLHATELHLRRLVTKHLAGIPVAIIATAADERPNSLESMDSAYFEDPTEIEWLTGGHEWLKKIIFRPAVSGGNSTDLTPCFWYEIQDFSKAIDSEAEDKDEPDSKQRRMRFRAIPIPPPGEEYAQQEGFLILTEAQVHAGMKAAEMETRNRASSTSDGNPFSGAAGDRVTLIPLDADNDMAIAEIHGRIVGYDNFIAADDEIEYRILLLPDASEENPNESFWATLDVRADTSSYVCQPIGTSDVWYSIEQFDYHNGSVAHQQCEALLAWLSRQSKAGPFAEPVDPVALNIPSYSLIVKNPMDISTMREKLENGQYSSILPAETKGVSPVSKMLNGPFRRDLELIFDNAMLFNPPDDWIYQAAAQLKKNALKKIAEFCQTADQKGGAAASARQRRSVYVDDDSDVDMYEYESDNDDDFEGGGRSKDRKRKRSARNGGQKDEFAARALEHPIRLQTTLRDANDLRGPFANLPINLSASSFSLPPQWSCRCSTDTPEPDDSGSAKKRTKEMVELLELQKVLQANESAGLRRSSRSHEMPSTSNRARSKQGAPLEYFIKDMAGKDLMKNLPTSRLAVEIQAESLHEEYYSRLYQSHATSLVSTNGLGAYSNGSFPPYLGRVIPLSDWNEMSWEIRAPFVVPALRWVLRGLIQSGHLTATEHLAADFSSGVILTNDIYFLDTNLKPFELLDLRELQRKKRANRENSDESEDEVEMSEYEKARADRVARNAERLKSLGLA